MNKVAVLCVWRTGGPYTSLDVHRLKRSLEKHISVPFDFYCLSNVHEIEGVNVIPLKHHYHGWWSKVELFRPNIVPNERILYFDLDTVIIRNIDQMLEFSADFLALQPFNLVNAAKPYYFASGIMGWKNDGTYNFLYEEFDYEYHSKKYMGDQDYLVYKMQTKGLTYTYWQFVYNGIYSYKMHFLKGIGRKNTRILCFHGLPRPSMVSIPKIKEKCLN